MRVFLVDGDVDALVLLREGLRSDSHDVRAFQNGSDAIAEHARAPAEVVVLELRLPDMNGLDVARALRDLHHPNPRLVALTGWSDDAHREQAARLGFAAFLVKPAGLKEIASAIFAGDRAAPRRDRPAG